jgi:hypothetical protein
MEAQIGPRSQVARIRHVSDDGRQLHLEFPSGQSATVDAQQPFDLPVGSVALVRVEDNHIEPAPDELWPDEPWVGVVRLRLDDVTVVDQSGRLHLLETNSVKYRVGNTVEARDSLGVVRVLDEKPIRFLDVPGIDDTVVAGFKTSLEAAKDTFEDFGGLKAVWPGPRLR